MTSRPMANPLLSKIIFIGLLCLSLYFLISVPIKMRAASQLDASPLCSVQEITDCVRPIKVTVISVSRGKSKRATVTMPDGSEEDLRLLSSNGWSLDSATLSQLIPGQEISARQWRGKVISLQTVWQRTILTSNNPHAGQILNLVIGVLLFLISVVKLLQPA